MADDIRLRDVTIRDLDVLFEFGKDPEAVRMAAFTHKDPSDRAAFDRHWQRLLADASIRTRVVEAKGSVLGSVASFLLEGQREVTYWIGREHWGKGIATAALAALLEIDQTRPIYAYIANGNAGSRRVLEKCGFSIVGEERWFDDALGAEIEEYQLELSG